MKKSNILRVAAPIHGRLLVREATNSPAPLLVGFHGYGENAERFLESMERIPGISEWHVVAVQALHRFYERRTDGVVASWMTSQDRDLAIRDNIIYVTRAIEEARKGLDAGRPTAFLGFSQGTAMAYRAAFSPGLECDAVIALGGDVPAEVETASTGSVLRVLVGRGERDSWYNEQKLDHDVALLTRMGSPVETCIFDGCHEWTDSFLGACGTFLESLLA